MIFPRLSRNAKIDLAINPVSMRTAAAVSSMRVFAVAARFVNPSTRPVIVAVLLRVSPCFTLRLLLGDEIVS